MNVPQQEMQGFHQQAYQLDMRHPAQHAQTSLAQNQQAAEPTQISEPPLPPQPPPVLTMGEEREIPANLVYLAAGGRLSPSYWGEVDIASITGIPEAMMAGEGRSRQTMEDTASAKRDSAQLAQMFASSSVQHQPNQAPPAAAPAPMHQSPPANAQPAASQVSTAMPPDQPNLQQASNAHPASNIPPIAMTSQSPPANAQPTYNLQSISTAPPPRSSQSVCQFAPPFDPRPFGKLQRTATGHWSRLTQPLASLPTVCDGQPASNSPSNTMALQPPPADAQPDADRLLNAMTSSALGSRPASNIPHSFARAPPPQSVYLPSNRQLPVNPYPLRDPPYRLTHMTYYNPPANYNRQPASNAPRTALASQPPSANDHSDPKHSSRTAAPSARTTHSSVNPHSTSNVQPAPDHGSAPTAPPSQLAQAVVKSERVSDAQQASAESSMPEAPDPQPAQPAPNSAAASLVQVAANPHSISNTLPTSATSSTSKAPDPQPAQPASDPAPASIPPLQTAQPDSKPASASSTPPEPAQPNEYHHPPMNAAQFYLERPPIDRIETIVMRELCTVYDNLTHAQRNALRSRYLATMSAQGRDEHAMKQVDPLVWYLREELKNERLHLTIDGSDDLRSNPVHLAAVKVKNRIKKVEVMVKQKEEQEMKIKVEGAVVSQPNGMPMGSGQPAGMLGGPQLGTDMNGGGRMSFYPSNVPVGSRQYFGAPGGQKLGNAVSAGGRIPPQPSNIPMSSGQHFGAANGQ
ncbi:hypothetical protein LTR17_002990 [Elasticomyces elasticus]|nr:hypothetical protein LTR17_002990 [Elasticomyces elasticus]